MNSMAADPVTILLVEDSAVTRKALGFLLASAGYQVLEADDGQAGLDLFTQQIDTIDLVVSDLVMPRMNGLEMLQALKQFRPQVKMILVTGLSIDAPAWREQGVYDWLAKTSAFEQLLDKVAAALAA
jgi:CheY-like chemotaxis protein